MSTPSRGTAGDLRARIAALADDARDVLDSDLHDADAWGADALEHLWERVSAEMTRVSNDLGDRRLESLVGLLGDIREAEAEQNRRRLARQSRMLAKVGSALAELSTARTVDELFGSVPEATCRLGFDRALVSTVDTAWRLHTMCVVRDPRWAEEIVAVGREASPLLDHELVENDSVEYAQAVLVHEVQDNPRVNRPLAEITKSSSYGIAPLFVDGEVVGLLHGDYYHQRRTLTRDDQSLLTVLAGGVSQALSRVTLLDGLAGLRTRLDGLGRWRPQSAVEASVIVARDDDEVLTRREVQIMRLMADGDSNAKIARRLVISEGTVKTHVTRILRKLHATNRAEAVAAWLRASGTTPAARR
ncbi:helix-turn-helix transcriptional regulator [Microbacterium sp. No. 7]|uniref:helix-turn-helix transcriptional regulator n=1 Tax=Microbacterium sp. No. 7 TaxID=1714373 RepID=UPI0006D1D64F|nr:LuxR C-terminal-related transcriptional regulator [Microbacterium sp. No. 7]ALJ18973.1 LuxR family transcriptional regulator [Microbacterium sp. No. 7]